MLSGAKAILITPILYDNEVLIPRRTINLPIDLAVDSELSTPRHARLRFDKASSLTVLRLRYKALLTALLQPCRTLPPPFRPPVKRRRGCGGRWHCPERLR